MRYYHYLSAPKVEMLHGQLPYQPSVGSTEVGFDVKFAKASRTSQRSDQLNVYEKLQAVEEWIYANEPVGSLDAPNVWISGRLLLGTYFSDPPPNPRIPIVPVADLVLYGTRDQGGAGLVMGGSLHNVITRFRFPDPEAQRQRYWSDTFYLQQGLQLFSEEVGSFAPDLLPAPLDRESDSTLARRIHRAALLLDEGVVGRNLGTCEFLAKRLMTIEHDHEVATLATPLFVSLYD
jgi:Family of unknown function (DUF7019)